MELIEAKIAAMIALGLGSLIMGLLPVLLTRFGRKNYPLLLSSLLCFGAGVLFSTSLLHMLPEIREDLGKDYEQYAELILCCGFFILYIVDEIVHLFYKEEDAQDEHENRNRYSSQTERRHSIDYPYAGYGATETGSLIQRQHPYNPEFAQRHSLDSAIDSTSCQRSSAQSQICHIGHEQPRPTKTATISLLIALTVHAILEGLAVGLESNTKQVLMMLGAVACHKLVVGFCLGTELSSSRKISACQYFMAIVLFSFGSSLGIALGMGISKLPKLLLPILQGLAGGTLLYVTVCEVLPRERAQWHKSPRKVAGFVQLLATGVGFSGMTILIQFTSV